MPDASAASGSVVKAGWRLTVVIQILERRLLRQLHLDPGFVHDSFDAVGFVHDPLQEPVGAVLQANFSIVRLLGLHVVDANTVVHQRRQPPTHLVVLLLAVDLADDLAAQYLLAEFL
jgi:hypothetical protein